MEQPSVSEVFIQASSGDTAEVATCSVRSKDAAVYRAVTSRNGGRGQRRFAGWCSFFRTSCQCCSALIATMHGSAQSSQATEGSVFGRRTVGRVGADGRSLKTAAHYGLQWIDILLLIAVCEEFPIEFEENHTRACLVHLLKKKIKKENSNWWGSYCSISLYAIFLFKQLEKNNFS